jgi:hypothetical protein
MTKKKITALPTNAADWDAKTCLRFLARFENLIRKVPIGVRERVYGDCTDSMVTERQREIDATPGPRAQAVLAAAE